MASYLKNETGNELAADEALITLPLSILSMSLGMIGVNTLTNDHSPRK